MTNIEQRAFRRVLKSAYSDEVIIPPLKTILMNPRFDGFEVPIPNFKPRPPDGWFHPSEHPLWGERLLYYYVQACADVTINLDIEFLDTEGAMATTQGTFWHSFLQHVMLVHDLVLIANPKGRFPHDKVENPVEDVELGSRGSMDGLLNPAKLKINEVIGLEIKTMRTLKLDGCPRTGPKTPETLEWFKKKCPEYYAQAQEYLRMSGYSEMRVLIIGLEYPFPMVEISVPFDYGAAMGVAEKYRRVRQHVAEGTIPDPCCAVMSQMSKQCPARAVCPIGLGKWD